MKLRKLVIAGAVLGAASALALGASAPASAGLIGCSGQQFATPFLPWLDAMPYTFVSNGGFESGSTGWRLSGGATVVTGNEPFDVHGDADARSLALPKGASATSPAICVGLGSPTMRFFSTGAPGASLKVEVLYPSLFGTASAPVLLAPGGGAWAPSLPLAFLGNILSLTSLQGTTANVQFRFTASGGSFAIDDLYVDPMRLP